MTDRLTYKHELPRFLEDAARQKIEKINRRASRLGVDTVSVRKIKEETRKKLVGHDPLSNKPVYVQVPYVVLEVTGTAPRLEGWDFIATIQHEDAGNILRKVPGREDVEVPVSYREASAWCDHCKTRRRRIDTFVVRSDDGAWKQVGRNCLSDFLGHDPNFVLSLLANWRSACDLGGNFDEDYFYSCGGWRSEWVGFDLLQFLSITSLCVREEGWLSRTAAKEKYDGRYATADQVWRAMSPQRVADKEHRRLKFLEKVTKQDIEIASAALEWAQREIVAKDVATRSDYEHNLAVAVQKDKVHVKEAGLIASLIVVHGKAVEREIKRKNERKDKKNEWFGAQKLPHEISRGKNKGKTVMRAIRYQLELVVVRIRYHEADWGTTRIYTFEDADGREFVWFGSSRLKDNAGRTATQGDKVFATWSVKSHKEFRGIKQTVLQRPSSVTFAQEQQACETSSRG